MKFVAIACALGLFLVPGEALAHARLKSSSPAANAKVASGFKEIKLEFVEAIEPSLSKFELDDQVGKAIAAMTGDKACADAKCKFEIAPLQVGNYTFKYHVLSGDGHVVDGKFDFAVTGGAG
jgi:methionine-rich copper-binding protein CopC